MQKIMFASTNQGKINELKKLLPNYELVTLLDYPDIEDIPETGKSYQENALIKAKYIHELFNIPVIAEDSGIEVYSLFGTKYGKDMAVPGIYSARYASNHNEQENNTELIRQLSKYPFDNQHLGSNTQREGKFISLICYIDEKGVSHCFDGVMFGVIRDTPKGTNGFAYDTLFHPLVTDLRFSDKTYAEMTDAQKQQVSHRAKSLAKFIDYLQG